MKLNLVTGNEQLLNRGDARVVTKNGLTQLVIACPRCGVVSASRGKHVYNKKTQTYKPSIVHDIKFGGCGWHGWLTNGEFTEC